MAIDVGSPAIDRAEYIGSGYTIVLKDNPANATGVIDHIEIYMDYGDNKVIEVASFYVVSGNNLSTRDSSGALTVNPGLNTFNAPGDFTAFDINEGDYIGIQIPEGAYIDYYWTGGAGRWYYYGDAIPCTNTTFLVDADYIFSLYATGTESGGATYTKTFTADAILTGSALKTFTLDALLEAIQLKTTVVDGYLVNRFTKAFSVDSILFGVVKKTFEVDAVLSGLATYTKTFIVDGYLVKRITKTVVVDGWLKGSPKKTFLIDAVVGFAYERKPLWYGKKYKVVGLRINLNEWKCELSLEEI